MRELISKIEVIAYRYSDRSEADIHISEMRNGGYKVKHQSYKHHGYVVEYYRDIN